MKTEFPDYDRSVLSVTASVLEYYGVNTGHKTLPELDKLLKKDYRNVIIMLFDGMGKNTIESNLGENSIIRKNKIADITSVFPSTTVAATTSIESGLSPAEHGWLGWTVYFKEIDKTITVFLNEDDNKEKQSFPVAATYIPYETIFSKINKTGRATAHLCSPFSETRDNTLEKIIEKASGTANTEGRHFIYCYCPEPDHTMHGVGIDGKEIRPLIEKIDRSVKEMAEKACDSLIITMADHGLINVEWDSFDNHPELYDMLERETSVEPRAVNIFVKPGKEQDFKEKFNEIFGDKFILLTKKEIYESKLFGPGEPHPHFDSSVGDFMALSTDRLCLKYKKSDPFPATHGGVTVDEMEVTLSAIESR